ncbi:MAG: DUF924 family protein [Myxococcota bacterium]
MTDRIGEIVHFWLGDLSDGTAAPAEDKRDAWFKSDPTFDDRIRQRFGEDVERALRGELDDWAQSPRGALALVLLLDQFTRNIFRRTPRAFAGDARALRMAQQAIERGHDEALHPAERAFLYMPFMHSEDLDVQERAVAMFRALAETSPPSLRPLLDDFHRHAVSHRDEILRFARFPGRNATLDRTTTPQELEFLKKR